MKHTFGLFYDAFYRKGVIKYDFLKNENKTRKLPVVKTCIRI